MDVSGAGGLEERDGQPVEPPTSAAAGGDGVLARVVSCSAAKGGATTP